MSNPAPEILDAVMTVLRRYPSGASLADIGLNLDPRPDEQTLRTWVNILMKQGRASQLTATAPARYTAISSAMTDAMTSGSQPAHIPTSADLYEQCAPGVIASMLPRLAATSLLQQQATFAGMTLDDAAAFVAYALERLDTLTPTAAENFGLTREQYDTWRQQYVPKVVTAPAPAIAPAPTAPAQPAVTRNSTRKAKRKNPPATGNDIEDLIRLPTANGAVPKQTVKAWSNRLTLWIDQTVPGGLGPTARTMLPGILTIALMGVVARAGAYLWLIILIPLALVALWWWVRRPTVIANDTAPATDPHSAITSAGTRISPALRYAIAAGVLLVISGAVGGLLYYRSQQYPAASIVGDYLASTAAPLPIRVATPDITFLMKSSSGCRLTYHALATTTAPLYHRIETDDYLRSHMLADLTAIDAAMTTLRGPNAARLRTAMTTVMTTPMTTAMTTAMTTPMTAAMPTPSIHDIILYRTQTPPGFATAIQGTLYAWRSDGTWVFTSEQGGIDRSRFPGEPKPAGALAIDQPGDSATLTKLVAEQVAYAAKVQAAATALADELAREREQRAKAIGQLVGRGTVYGGTVTTRSETARVALEIMESTAAHRVVALLRNDGGWTDTRRFQGEWALDAEAEAGVVTLRTQNDEAIGRGGPLLETAGTWSVVLQVHTDGTATDDRGEWQLHRLDAAETAALKADFTRTATQALDATKAGLVYRGTSTSAKDGTIESLYLRFVEQTPDGVTLRATLESANVAGRSRPFRGSVVGNTYRAGRNPIRLRSPDSDRSRVAEAKSPLGLNTTNDSLGLALRVDGTRLVGEDDRFVYQFERAPDGAAAVPVGAASALDPGPENLDPARSVATKDQGPGTRDSAAAAAAPSAPDARSQTLDAAAVAADPARSADAARKPRALFGSADVEQIIVRSLKNFAAQPGAYVFFEGGWVPLPKNNGRAVQGLAQSLNGKLNALTRWEDKLTGKTAAQPASESGSPTPVAQIAFDGRTKVPIVGGKNLTLLFVGRVEPLSADILARYPELKTYPLVELAPLKTLPNGTRVAPLVEVAPGLIAFGPGRVEAMLETPVAGFTLLRCPERLAPAHYALTAGNQIFEVEVE